MVGVVDAVRCLADDVRRRRVAVVALAVDGRRKRAVDVVLVVVLLVEQQWQTRLSELFSLQSPFIWKWNEDEGGHGELGVSRLALLLVAVVARDLGGAHCVRGDARHALLVVVVARGLGDAHGVCGDARRVLLVVAVARGLGDAHGVREDARQALLVVVVLGAFAAVAVGGDGLVVVAILGDVVVVALQQVDELVAMV